MKLAYSKYTLIEKGTRAPKEGALLRIELDKEKFGYADIHPCASHGDLPLKDQLALLGERERTPLTSQSILFAKYDALARKEKHNLLKDIELPESNTLIVNDHQNMEQAISNAKIVKIKVSQDWKKKMEKLKSCLESKQNKQCKIRLDFSESLSESEFLDFLTKNSDLKPFIDYIEDPFLFNANKWEKFRREHNIRLGCDHKSSLALKHPNSCDVVIVKPAIQPIDYKLFKRLKGRELVITSYLDHPIGQLCAAYVAAGTKRMFKETAAMPGITTHEIFEPTPFSQRLSIENGRLIAPKKGYGWGYDDLLKGTTWVLL